MAILATKGAFDMKKRLLSGLLCAALALTLAPTASAKLADVPEKEKAAVLRELEVMVGMPGGDLELERAVNRAEFTKMAVAESPYKDSVGETAATDPYPDVPRTHWSAPYVRTAVDLGLVQGDLEGYFHPQREITLAEGVTEALRLLGYQDTDFSGPWPTGQIALYRSLDLDTGVTAQGAEDTLTRRDCLHLFYNLLTVPTKSGMAYIQSLGHTLNQDGEVDIGHLFEVEREGPIALTGQWESKLPFDVADALIYRDDDRATLDELRPYDLLYWAKDQAILFAYAGTQGSMGQMSQAVDGPVVAEGSWKGQIPFVLADAQRITRNGSSCQETDIAPQDVVYWSKYSKELFVYSHKVTGTVESVSPSLAAPTAVTIAGRVYALETFEAQYAFSDLGSFRRGDKVTLLLGRTGGAAAVRTASGTVQRQGVVTSVGTTHYSDDAGRSYVDKTVSLLSSDGLTYTLPSQKDDWKAGDLVLVTWTDGVASVAACKGQSLSGTVSANKIGALALSPDVEILDTYGDHQAKTVPTSRLVGMELTSGMVRGYTVDDSGAVDALILKDATGDLHRYGVLTDTAQVRAGMYLQGSYTVNVAGQETVIPVQGKQFSVQKGPCVVKMDGQEVDSIRSLEKLSDITLQGETVTSDNKSYTLADDAAFYLYNKEDKEYTYATREQVMAAKGVLSAWYDAPDNQGGRVRVVVAQVEGR